MADIVVEHAGLSDEQMRGYVKKNLTPDQSNSLLSFLKQHTPSSIAEIAHVPVNLEILCFLWKDPEAHASVLEAVGQASLPGRSGTARACTSARHA